MHTRTVTIYLGRGVLWLVRIELVYVRIETIQTELPRRVLAMSVLGFRDIPVVGVSSTKTVYYFLESHFSPSCAR